MRLLPVTIAALALVGCAQSVRYDQFPAPDLTPAQLAVAKPCTHLPALRNVNMNLGGADSGWSNGKPPAGMVQKDCGDRYWLSLYCKDPAKCQNATYGTATPPTTSSGEMVWVIDVLEGQVNAAAQLSNRFYVGSGEAKKTPCKATGGMPVRCSYKVQVVGQAQKESPTELVFSATEPTVVGLIGTVVPPGDVMNPAVTTSADGTVTITAEVELPQDEDEQPAVPPQGDPVADIIGGVARGVSGVLGGIWDAIRPDARPPAAEPEE